MIDVNKITSTLAKLPDQQLQQYAQMHKNDPYIMALAMSESNRRKEMRAAGQGSMQEQPKVVDQEIARMAEMQNPSPEQMAQLMQMLEAKKQAEYDEFTGGGQAQPMPQQLPEEMGIGQLPAGNMDFAGGGIVAFADGGDVERYNGTQGSFVDDGSAFAPSLITGLGYQPQQESSALGRAITDFFTRSDDLDAIRQKARTKQAQGLPLSAQEKTVLQADAPAATPAKKVTPTYSPDDLSGIDRRLKAGSQPNIPSINVPEPPRKENKRENIPVATLSAQPQTGGIDALQEKYFGNFDEKQGEFKDMREKLVKGIKDLTAANLVDVEADAAARSSDVVYAGREKRLAKQEKDIEGLPDRYLGLALLQAGAAMMATPGGLAAAIGKGAVIGADRYAAGLEKINAAQAKFAESRDRLDELRLNRDDMNAKEVRTAKREAKAADLRGLELLLNGAEKDWGVEREVLGKLFTAAKEDLRTDKTIRAQRDIAAMKGGQDRMKDEVFQKLLVDNGNDPVKAMMAFNKLMAKTEDLEAYYKKQQLDKLADARVKQASMGGVGIPGQKENLDALERQLMGNQVKVASRADIAATAKSSGKTEQQVTEALRARGYTIQ